MKRLKYDIKIVPSDPHATPKEIKLTTLKIYSFLTAFFILLGALGFATYRYVTLEIDYKRQVRLERENQKLKKSLQEMESKVAVIRKKLDQIYEWDNKLRTIAELPLIPPAQKQMGIGGTLEIPKDSLDKDLFNLDTELNRMLKYSDYELKSLSKIHNKLARDEKLRRHTPSIYPTSGILTSPFGFRRDPFTGKIKHHDGIDISAPEGTPIVAPADGIVRSVRWVKGYGLMIEIDHGFGVTTRYGHCSRSAVRQGQFVRRGQVIGYVGNTGRSTGPHLHYEVRVMGRPINPIKYIIPDTVLYD